MISNVEPLKLKQTMVGPFFYVDQEALACHLGVCTQQLRNYKTKAMPRRLLTKIKDMGDLLSFPLDRVLPVEVIGRVAHEAYNELRMDNCVRAADSAGNALQDNAVDSATTLPLELTLLQRLFLRMIRGVAFARMKATKKSRLALPALRELHREVTAAMIEVAIDNTHLEWEAWSYLRAMTCSYTLCYHVMEIGKEWFREDAKPRDADERRQAAKLTLEEAQELGAFDQMGTERRHVANLIAWNLIQLAALADLDTPFIQCLASLYERCTPSFELLKLELNEDADTKLMMSHERVATFLSRLEIPPLKD